MRPAPVADFPEDLAPDLAQDLAIHALGWLTAGCAVGVLLTALLAWPAGNALLAPLTYGRWAPVHLDLLLYGWTALPLVGLLLRLYLPGRPGAGPGRLALAVWSGALGAGAVALLAGGSSGKLFLDWSGSIRLLWLGALVVLWGGLAFGLLLAWRRKPRASGARRLGLRSALLLLLAGVPWAIARALDPQSYPPIDPTTGGPTGTDLAASTVAIVPMFLALPTLLGLERPDGAPRALPLWLLLALHAACLPLFGFGDRSHQSPLQIAAIASVLIWPLPLARFLLAHRWPAGSTPWLWALGAWGTALATSALVTFLPGVLDAAKFTHALVGHAHLAMGGFTSAFSALALHALLSGSPAEATFTARVPFASWQIGTAAQVAALVLLGVLEAGDVGVLFRADGRVSALLALRGAGGCAMLFAAANWLRLASREGSG
jgi:cytochrome c oxidase cbb3-type subunit 1